MHPPCIEFPHIPESIKGLADLAANLWWSWHPAARMVFKSLDRQAWKESGHNPVKMLRDLPPKVLEAAAQDIHYLRHYNLVLSRFQKEVVTGTWRNICNGVELNSHPIAYFSAEYGLHHSLPFYAGGLGFLAGDYLKECSDMCLPVIGIGFMYPEGYFRQRIREDGWQENMDEPLNREEASICRHLNDQGEQMIIRVPLIDPPIYVSVWRIDVGRVPLYLMDTDIDMNDPWNRRISSRLYISEVEQRLRQEIVLGIGGSAILEKLGIRDSTLHLNEGHPSFALLERIRDHVTTGSSFEAARKKVERTSIFTTHTPVPAGHDVFPFHLMEKYFGSYWPSLGLNRDSFLALGVHPETPHEGFNMTAFALRMCAHRNAVSRRHGEVARRMWKSLWPDLSEEQASIAHITNGIHVPKWIEPKMELLFNRYLGPDWLEDHDNPLRWELIDEIPDEELWNTHYWMKIKLIDAIRERYRRRWAREHVSPSIIMAGGILLDPSILTIGFARRFTAYKRADLILYDTERMQKLLNDRWRPIQIIFAGKAHPDDDPGKRILQRIFNAAQNPEMGGRIAFLEDYGEQFAQYMVHGVDVWLNNPAPPLEACGTSGMKAALNGVPHLSILDGWWCEGYNGKNGWAFESDKNAPNPDASDSAAIYDILENQVIPVYYSAGGQGVPREWVRIMKESIKSCAHRFSARRMIKDYIDQLYARAVREF